MVLFRLRWQLFLNLHNFSNIFANDCSTFIWQCLHWQTFSPNVYDLFISIIIIINIIIITVVIIIIIIIIIITIIVCCINIFC